MIPYKYIKTETHLTINLSEIHSQIIDFKIKIYQTVMNLRVII